MDYHFWFERLTELMTALDGFDIPGIFEALTELCKILRVSKGVTTFYGTREDEKAGKGQAFVCYDSGEKHVLVSSARLETPGHVVITCDVYQAEGAEPLTELERKRVGTIQRMMLTFTNRSRQDEIIKKLTYWDAEGYFNLRYYYDQIMRLVSEGIIANNTAARLNLKHFSLINEQLGKPAGDALIRRFTQTLVETFEDNGMVCRLGGDNFVLLFETRYLPEVLKCLEGMPLVYDQASTQRVELSAAAGLFNITEAHDIREPGEIMGPITAAYQIAKKESTPDIVFYNDELQRRKSHELEIQRKFQAALDTEEFLVYYQPKVDIETRELVGAEALCRWMHEGSIVPPMAFIPALERGSDICRLDFYMLDHVCRDIRRWLDERRQVVRVSVNLSRRHMIDPDLFQHIVEVIDRNRVPHEYIEIELTETTTDVEFKDLKRIVTKLQQAGINTSVDDFGVGYSSLNLIKQIPWNVLKLDKSIIPAKGENVERGSRMFAHIIAMAHEIGLKCVAEGIETNEQMEIMRHYGCRVAQGFLFDRPLPVADFEERLDHRQYT